MEENLKKQPSPSEFISLAPATGTFLMNQRLSSLGALIFMMHGNFDTEKVSVTFSRVRKFFYFSRKLQSSNDLINARFLGHGLRACQFGAALAVRHAEGSGREGLKERKKTGGEKRGGGGGGEKGADG